MNSKPNKDQEEMLNKDKNLIDENRNENMKSIENNERSIVARLKIFPKSRRKSVMERSRKIAATRLTPNASQELNRFESHNPQRDFNEERYHQDTLWRHEGLRAAKDDDSVSEYLIIPDRDRVI